MKSHASLDASSDAGPRARLRARTAPKVAAAFLGVAAAAVFGACTVVNGEHVFVTAGVDGASDAHAPTPTDAMGADSAPPEDATIDAARPDYPTLLSLPSAASVCRWALACPELAPSMADTFLVPLPAPSIDTYSACVDVLGGAFPAVADVSGIRTRMLDCIAAATSCDGALACLPFEEIASPSTTPDCAGFDYDAGGTQCSADRTKVLECAGEPDENVAPLITTCDSGLFVPGETCNPDVGTCAQLTNCSPTGAKCTNNVAYDCLELTDGATYQSTLDCTVRGLSCQVFSADYADCTANSANTTCSTSAQCTGASTLSVCAYLYQSFYDCSTVGAKCTSDPVPRCAASDATCSPYDNDHVNLCNGTNIQLCIGGQPTTFDCASINATCAADSLGQHGTCQ